MKPRGWLVVPLALLSIAADSSRAPDRASRVRSAREVTDRFQKDISSAFEREMAAGGPIQAMRVCGEIAPTIAGRISRERGWRVTRVGTRVRNPLLGTPDAWEQQILRRFAERLAAGEKPGRVVHSEIVREPGGQVFRYMRAITVGPGCVVCHGTSGQIPAEVKSVLAQRYPKDGAVGYRPGELRGAFSVRQPIEDSKKNAAQGGARF